MSRFGKGEMVEVVEESGSITCTQVLKTTEEGDQYVFVLGDGFDRQVDVKKVFGCHEKKELSECLKRLKAEYMKRIVEIDLSLELTKYF